MGKSSKQTLISGRMLAGCGLGSVGILGIIGLLALCPVCFDGATAVEPTQKLAQTDVTAAVASVVSVALDTEVGLDVTPRSTGSFATSAANLTIATNNESGYALYLKTANGESALKNTDQSNPAKIEALPANGEGYTAAGFGDNTWGYNLTKGKVAPGDNTRYQAVPTETGAALLNETETTMQDDYTLSFGTKINTSLPAGTYNNAVVVSVVANPITITSLNQLIYMQDMTSDICQNTAENVTKQLVDTRDGKSYWVAKLKDGNCWMTQNLGLDLEAEHVFTSEDTNLEDTASKTWTVPVDRTTENTLPLPNSAVANDTRSWNLGKIILTNPTESKLCPQATVPNDSNNYPNTDKMNSAYHGQNIATACSEYYKNVEGWSGTYTASLTKSYDDDAQSYDAHYLIGNYYQFAATTAGTSIGLTGNPDSGNDASKLIAAPGSICPKGWTLPKSGGNTNADTNYQPFNLPKSFYSLLKEYGYDYNENWSIANGNTYVPISNGTNPTGAPLFFTRSGSIAPDSGSLRDGGFSADLWSSVLYPSSATVRSAAYNLRITNTSIYPATYRHNYIGYTIRCLAK